MAELFWLNDEQWAAIEPLLPHPGGEPRVNDRRVVSGILHRFREGLRWRAVPDAHGPCGDRRVCRLASARRDDAILDELLRRGRASAWFGHRTESVLRLMSGVCASCTAAGRDRIVRPARISASRVGSDTEPQKHGVVSQRAPARRCNGRCRSATVRLYRLSSPPCHADPRSDPRRDPLGADERARSEGAGRARSIHPPMVLSYRP